VRQPYLDTERIKDHYRHLARSAERFGGVIDIFANERLSETGQQGITASHAAPFSYLYQYITEVTERILEQLQARSPAFSELYRKLRWGFLFNDTPNAYAWRDKQFHYVGITSGLVHLLYEAFSTLLSDPNCLSVIDGEGDEEDLGIPARNFMDRYFVHQRGDLHLAYTHGRHPRGPIRSLMLLEMLAHAVLFATLHEIGHLVMGHLDLLGMKSSQETIAEIYLDSDDEFDTLMLRPLWEHQADNFSVLVSIESIASRIQDENISAEVYGVWSAAVDVLLWMFSKGPIQDYSLLRSHPHAQMRIFYKTERIMKIREKIRVDWVAPSGKKLRVFELCAAGTHSVARDWARLGFGDRYPNVLDVDQFIKLQARYTRYVEQVHAQIEDMAKYVNVPIWDELLSRYYDDEERTPDMSM
jgi:hypothetical protein